MYTDADTLPEYRFRYSIFPNSLPPMTQLRHGVFFLITDRQNPFRSAPSSAADGRTQQSVRRRPFDTFQSMAEPHQRLNPRTPAATIQLSVPSSIQVSGSPTRSNKTSSKHLQIFKVRSAINSKRAPAPSDLPWTAITRRRPARTEIDPESVDHPAAPMDL
ncbi:hypothetical protein ACLOJK_037556 [Asimina triloba]